MPKDLGFRDVGCGSGIRGLGTRVLASKAHRAVFRV